MGSEGLISVSGCEDARVGDVVFVHGLDGDAWSTWQNDGPREDSWPFWIGAEFPQLGVWTLGYAVSSSAWRGHSMPLVDRATHTLDLFDLDDIGQRPVAFVCHSLGGLLVKQALRTARESNNPRMRRLADSTRLIVFLSTPRSGSDIASWLKHAGALLRTTCSVDELQAHDSRLRELNLWYLDRAAELEIETFVYCEKRKTKGVLVVNETSADPGIAGVRPVPLDADHISICKPESRKSQVCRRVNRLIRENLPATHAPATEIGGEWCAEVHKAGQPVTRIALSLVVANQVLMGTVVYRTGSAGFRNGVIDGKRIAFETRHTPQFQDEPVTLRFEGTIGDGTIEMLMQDDSGHGRVVARRAEPPA